MTDRRLVGIPYPLVSTAFAISIAAVALLTTASRAAHAQAQAPGVTQAEVEQAIREGVRFLKDAQNPRDGSWADPFPGYNGGMTALVTLALLTAGEPVDEPHVARALKYLEQYDAEALEKTYCVALQTMAFAQADPARYKVQLLHNVQWLERAQIQQADRTNWPGSWTYTVEKLTQGDNSNTQYALLGLHAASEAGIPVHPQVWSLARQYWELAQRREGLDRGGFGYKPGMNQPTTGSMTCAGLASLLISGSKRYEGRETINGDTVHNCGAGGFNPSIQAAVEWLGARFRVDQNVGAGGTWKYYYLYGLERAGRLSGLRYFGNHDWYFEGAEHLIHDPGRDPLQGKWQGGGNESDPVLTTAFVVLFLAKGRAPVIINKLAHGPGNDWQNDRDDIRNLTTAVSRDWKRLVTYQLVDPETATVEDLLMARIAYFNGHKAPEFSEGARKRLREFVEQGGLIFAEACCGDKAFDTGFRAMMAQMFPEEEYQLQPLSASHPVWRARFPLTPDVHPLEGIEFGCRTAVIYSPKDLSCFWNQMEVQPDNPAVVKATRVGHNVVDYATGREAEDKLATRTVTRIDVDTPQRGALRIGKLRYGRDWNLAPLAIPNLTTFLRQSDLKFDVVINHREITSPSDPNLTNYPLLYMHGRTGFTMPANDQEALRKHLDPGGGLLFADAACGAEAFDTAFRALCKTLYPDHPLEPIPPDDRLLSDQSGFDLSQVTYTKAAGGATAPPQLEGIKLNNRWVVIYSKYDIGCSLERQTGIECKGYVHESALRIGANVVIYATLP
jgi:hypothetical protein